MSSATEQFNDLLLRGREWFMARDARERMILGIGATALACALVYAILFAPLASAINSRNTRIEQKRSDLAWMQSVAPQVSAFASQPGIRNSGESMVVLIANSASISNVGNALAGQTPEGSNAVQVRFTGVQFDALVLWLNTLQREYGIRTTVAEINRTAQAGQVNASLSLQRN